MKTHRLISDVGSIVAIVCVAFVAGYAVATIEHHHQDRILSVCLPGERRI